MAVFLTNICLLHSRAVCGVGLKDLFGMYDAYPVHELCFLVMSIHSAEEAIPAQARVGGDTCKGRPPPVGYSCERPAFPVPRLVPSVNQCNPHYELLKKGKPHDQVMQKRHLRKVNIHLQ